MTHIEKRYRAELPVKRLKDSEGKAPNLRPSTDPADRIIRCLENVRETGPAQWIARCPSHDDRSPSLSIKRTGDRVLLHCFAGCRIDAILSSLGLSLGDLFDRPIGHKARQLSGYDKRRLGQAREALKALRHEIDVVYALAKQMAAGFALDPAEQQRLKTAKSRLRAARRLAG